MRPMPASGAAAANVQAIARSLSSKSAPAPIAWIR